MANPKLWSNVSVSLESSLDVDRIITAITIADPAIVTSAAHGLDNGDYIILDIQGMEKLDGRVVRVANKQTDSFELEGVSTIGFDPFLSGKFNKIVYGTTLGIVKDLSATGGEPNFVEVSTIHDSIAKQIPGLPSAIDYSLTNIWDVSDAGAIAMKKYSDSRSRASFKFVFSDGQIMVFNGYVSAPNIPTGSGQELIVSQASISMFGSPTYYSS